MKRACKPALWLLISGTCLTWTVRAHATASTHVWGPSTDVQAFNIWHLTTDMYAADGNDAAGRRPPTITNLGITVGVIPARKVNLEMGVDHKTGLGPLDNHPLYGNAKLGVPENAFGTGAPALAAGVFDVGTKSGMTDYNIWYGKIARTFTAGALPLGRLSTGYFAGSGDLLLDGRGAKDNDGLMVAWERTMSEISDRLWLCLEYMGGESLYGTLNLGLSWKFADNVSVLGGYDFFNNDDLVDTATVQVDIDIF